MYRLRERVSAAIAEWHERGAPYEIAKWLTAPTRRLLVRSRIEGDRNLPEDGPMIVASNHLSFFDSVVLTFSLPRQVRMLGKVEYADRRLTRWLFVCGAGMIPVRRENPGDSSHEQAARFSPTDMPSGCSRRAPDRATDRSTAVTPARHIWRCSPERRSCTSGWRAPTSRCRRAHVSCDPSERRRSGSANPSTPARSAPPEARTERAASSPTSSCGVFER